MQYARNNILMNLYVYRFRKNVYGSEASVGRKHWTGAAKTKGKKND